MAGEIPEALKANVPKGRWGKLLLATPVVMTVVATLLAGLASSELTRAQYDRSLAAQVQSKAGDQWAYFQAKKLRAAMQQSTIDVFQATGAIRPLDATRLARFGGMDAKALAALQNGEMPEVPASKLDPNLKAALDAVESAQPEADVELLLGTVKDETVEDALKAARANSRAFDAAVRPITEAMDQLDKTLATSAPELTRDYTVARLRFTSLRYEREARLNQAVANLLELQVRKGTQSAERHRRRSQRFFYGMLAAQAAVIVSTLSLAAQKRTVLWGLAAAAGLAAVVFAAYVYFWL